MYTLEQIQGVHLEITSRCNARCPQCSRNVAGGATIANLPLTELTFGDIRDAFQDKFVRNLKYLHMCGVYGDPMVARDTLEVFRWLRGLNPALSMVMETNGSGRPAEWWEELAGLGTRCVFGIDGLSDTNHLYRRGTEWERVMASARAFIHAGGQAEWAFIVFRHNEHQVDEAARLSREMGFCRFTRRVTDRFKSRDAVQERLSVLDLNGRHEYWLEMPADERYRPLVQTQGPTTAPANGLPSAGGGVAIECKAAARKKIYVSAEGLVFPCCWVAKIYRDGMVVGETEMGRILATVPGGRVAIDLKKRALEEILRGELFQSVFPAKWQESEAGGSGLRACEVHCGARPTG